MIAEKCFTAEYIDSLIAEYGGNPILYEKCIHAFALLEHLSLSDIPFLFKGGTSLLLHLPIIRRLSIDIDIVSHISGAELDMVVERIGDIPPFLRSEESERGVRGLPQRRHFKMFYHSQVEDKESFVLLDVVEEDECVLVTEQKDISMEFLQMESLCQVTMPTIEALLGDKITAFAPNTIGVPYVTEKGRSMTMQVVKQLFDIGELYNIARDFDAVRIAFDASYEMEKKYREEDYSREDVLHDIIETGLGICAFSLKGPPSFNREQEMLDGVKRLRSHLIRDSFTMVHEAKIAAAKAVHLASSLLSGKAFPFEVYTGSEEQLEELETAELSGLCRGYNRLKVVLPDAFFYLNKAENSHAV